MARAHSWRWLHSAAYLRYYTEWINIPVSHNYPHTELSRPCPVIIMLVISNARYGSGRFIHLTSLCFRPSRGLNPQPHAWETSALFSQRVSCTDKIDTFRKSCFYSRLMAVAISVLLPASGFSSVSLVPVGCTCFSSLCRWCLDLPYFMPDSDTPWASKPADSREHIHSPICSSKYWWTDAFIAFDFSWIAFI